MHPTGAALGADIAGIDLAGALGPETVAAIKAAWAAHLVLRFRGQRLSDDDLLRFSRQFGELDWAPIAAARVKVPREERYVDAAPEGRQYLMVISNVIEDGVAIEARGRGLMCAIDLREPRADEVTAAMLDAGYLINNTSDHTLRFLPPLVIDGEDLAGLVTALQTVLAG